MLLYVSLQRLAELCDQGVGRLHSRAFRDPAPERPQLAAPAYSATVDAAHLFATEMNWFSANETATISQHLPVTHARPPIVTAPSAFPTQQKCEFALFIILK